MTIQAAERVLLELKDLDVNANIEQRDRIQYALATLMPSSDYQIFGVCASSQAEGVQALESYAEYFGYLLIPGTTESLPQTEGSVYLKYNPRNRSCYVEGYTGTYRGVLISFQSDFEDGYKGTHGHFPLNLFG
jgi:Domain of unknown function (DUF1824)